MADQSVIVGVGTSGAVALDSLSGRRLWSHPAGMGSLIAISDGFFTWATGNELGVADLQTGIIRWKHQFRGDVRQLAIGSSGVFAVESSGILHAIDLQTGAQVWQRATKSEFSALLATGEVLYLSETGMRCQALDAVTGKTIWQERGKGNHVLLSTAGTEDNSKVIC